MTTQSPSAASPSRTNVPELSVSELAFSLKRTLEETYGRVRVRGELGRVTVPKSGHMYADLKDNDAVLNAICWKGTLPRLSVKPEEGLEVICTGRVTTYPARSNYQLIIESMELAGEGALLKMLEERKKKLAAEGLFAPERKKSLPFLPEIIGVVTSPTGAVIRDIMHRLDERFPRRVLLWPVLVQGPGAAEQVAAAIRGFNGLQKPLRPDILIVARGGGSLEDLMPFNEEIVVRAAAECAIPIISAIGHETDVTLIDYAADRRAPTPTGAAEMAVPVRLDLIAQIHDDGLRLTKSVSRLFADLQNKLSARAAKLGDPARLLELKTQQIDHAAHKMTSLFERFLSRREARNGELAARLPHPRRLIDEKARLLSIRAESLARLGSKMEEEKKRHLDALSRTLESLSFKRVLDRGFAVVKDGNGKILTAAGQTEKGRKVRLNFKNDECVGATIDTDILPAKSV
ncbi:MAG: exodeoxyribonuclease VII large subunit [Proteobacteria bacterium]|nr:exodeoxyribonuclease VII large subunit [Pseudomonadota bacterium]